MFYLINSILDLSKIKKNEIILKLEEVKISNIIDHIESLFKF